MLVVCSIKPLCYVCVTISRFHGEGVGGRGREGKRDLFESTIDLTRLENHYTTLS